MIMIFQMDKWKSDDVCLNVLNTVCHWEHAAYSFGQAKSCISTLMYIYGEVGHNSTTPHPNKQSSHSIPVIDRHTFK